MNDNVVRFGDLFLKTLRDNPAEADVTSHQLLLRAGYIRSVAPGIFTWLPLGLRVLKKVENIVREEMNAIGSNELHFPALLPREPYESTGRWTEYGAGIFRLKDRRQNDYLLAPTHEEMFALIVKDMVSSYKDLPQMLYQIQTKYRDEARPRAGLLRGREFIMKDAYSFDLTDEGLMESYEKQRGAYERIFTRLGLPYRIVKATSGAMGGSASEEFLSPTPIGEDTFVVAPSGYAANVEAAEIAVRADMEDGEIQKLPKSQEVKTPGAKTIAEVTAFFGAKDSELLKSVYLTLEHPIKDSKTDKESIQAEVVIICIPGDRELDMKRAEAFFAPAEVRTTTPEDLKNYPQLVAGFVGPSDELAKDIRYFFDTNIYKGSFWIAGANIADTHVENLVAGRDFQINAEKRVSLVEIRDGDEAADGSGKFEIQRGVEIGHIFALGRKYTEAFDIKVLDENGKAQTPTMGSYGIGITRALALLAEDYNDDKGLAWPKSVAPFDLHIVIAAKENEANDVALKFADKLSETMNNGKKIEILVDDRKQSPGVKFKDAELLGVPVIIVLGRGLKNEVPSVEIKYRDGSNVQEVKLTDLVQKVKEYL